MASQNVRMHGPAQVSNVAAVKYTAPSGQVATLQHIHVQNPSAVGVTFTLAIGTDAASTRVYDAYTIGAGQVLDVFCKYVLNAGETIQALSGTNNVLTLTLDGQVQSILPEGSAAAFRTLYEVDLRNLPTQTMQAAGSYVVDGKTWWAKGPVKNTAAFGLIGGTGWQFSFTALIGGALNWRTSGDVTWSDRVYAFPLSQLVGYNPEAPLAVLWRATGVADANIGDPAMLGGFCNAALSSADLTASEKATSVAFGYAGGGSTNYFITSPHNNSASSQWNAHLTSPTIVPANELSNIVNGIYRVSTSRFLPLVDHWDGALGDPNTAIDYDDATSPNTSAVRTGNGQSTSPCFVIIPQMPGGGPRAHVLTHLKFMQPFTQ